MLMKQKEQHYKNRIEKNDERRLKHSAPRLEPYREKGKELAALILVLICLITLTANNVNSYMHRRRNEANHGQNNESSQWKILPVQKYGLLV